MAALSNIVSVGQELEYPLKHHRIWQLFQFGQNIPNYIAFPPGGIDFDQLRKFFNERGGLISCRTFRADDKGRGPFKPEQKDWGAIVDFVKETNPNYFSLFNETLPRADNIYQGSIRISEIFQHVEMQLEYLTGSGYARDIEYGGINTLKSVTRRLGHPWPEWVPEILRNRAFELTKFHWVRPLIVEFSYYPYPVGMRKSRFLCWEWRKG